MMLQQKAKNRPSAEKLFTSSIIENKIMELNLEAEKMNNSFNEQLLKTIRIPKKLHYLTDRLPKSNYDNLSDPGYSIEISKKVGISSKGSLPKIGKVSPQQAKRRKYEKETGNRGLLIEGRSKMIGDIRSQEKVPRNLERDIRNELRKIYKVRQVGHSYEPKQLKRS